MTVTSSISNVDTLMRLSCVCVLTYIMGLRRTSMHICYRVAQCQVKRIPQPVSILVSVALRYFVRSVVDKGSERLEGSRHNNCSVSSETGPLSVWSRYNFSVIHITLSPPYNSIHVD